MAYKNESFYKYYIIYKTTCIVNNKIYIGQHRTNHLDDSYLGSGKLLNEDIEKYGSQNFTREILFVYDNFDDMNKKEIELVTPEFVAREDTYNMIIGGQIDDHQARRLGGLIATKKEKEIPNFCRNTFIKKTQEERKIIIDKIRTTINRKISTGEIIPSFLGKHHSSETKAKIGKANSIHQHGSGNSQYGKHWWMNPKTGESKLLCEGKLIPEGWIKGRKMCK